MKRSLVLNLSQVAGELEQIGDRQKPGIRVFGAINIFLENRMVVLEVRFSISKINIFDAILSSGNQVRLMMSMPMLSLQLFSKQNQAIVQEIQVRINIEQIC